MNTSAQSHTYIQSFKWLFCFTLISLLAACSGGSSGGGSGNGGNNGDGETLDTTPPVITLNGESIITLFQGDEYSELGATATDDRDGSVEIVTTGSVDTNTPNDYIITYTATDAAGNISMATRTITILGAFITTWKTDNEGLSEDNQILIMTVSGSNGVQVDWGDGSNSSHMSGDITHTYASAGTYTVAISGELEQIFFPDAPADPKKLLTVEQWGDTEWKSMEYAFGFCSNLSLNALDTPDLSQVTDMSGMFYYATNFNQDIGTWDVSSVKNMRNMFTRATNFNQDIGAWDVSAVENMSSMFSRASNFNQDIGAWNVSAVENMLYMFGDAKDFNQDISLWGVSSVEEMRYMFNNATSFNQNIGTWNVSAATNMTHMFEGATDFDQDIGSWDVSLVDSMTDMFKDVTLSSANYNALLIGWSVRSLQNNVSFHAGNSEYSSDALSARNTLTNSEGLNWSIADGGCVDCP